MTGDGNEEKDDGIKDDNEDYKKDKDFTWCKWWCYCLLRLVVFLLGVCMPASVGPSSFR